MDIVELFFSYKRDSKEMHFIYDYGNYNWKEKKKKKKTFIKNLVYNIWMIMKEG